MFKKLLSLMLCVALVFTMGTIAFATEDTEEKTVTTQTEVTEEVKTEDEVVTDAPATDAPATDAPATDAPATDAPATDAPATDAPATDAPATDAPATDAPATDAPATDAPATDAPATDAPATDAPATDAPATDAPATEPIKLVVTDSNLPVQVNGVAVSFEDVGLKKVTVDAGDITLVPIRKIAEMLNCTVAWRNSDQTVHIFKNGKSVVLAINNPVIKIYDFEVGAKFVYTSEAEEKFVYAENKGVTPVIEAGRTLVPLRAISECLNTTVNYDGATGLITINDNDAAMLNYKATIADIKARNLIETYNYKPVVELKSGSIIVKVAGNFEGATAEIGDGVTVTIDGKAQTAANGGTCTFTEMKSGTYKVEVTNIPEGFALQNAETTVTVEGGEVNVSVYLVKAEATDK